MVRVRAERTATGQPFVFPTINLWGLGQFPVRPEWRIIIDN